MIWPWSEIERWKRQAVWNEELLIRAQSLGETHRAEYLKLASAMRGAHKGIWRLKQKLKKYEKEQEVTHRNFNRQLFERAPCYLCGYNGELYYQPAKHPCAKLYHQRVDEEQG